MHSSTAILRLVAVASAITGVTSSPAPEDTSQDTDLWYINYHNDGWFCVRPDRSRIGSGTDWNPPFGNTLCLDQVRTCQAFCSTRGGTRADENVCISDNDGEDDPSRSINYCTTCKCQEDAGPNPVAEYSGSLAQYMCRRLGFPDDVCNTKVATTDSGFIASPITSSSVASATARLPNGSLEVRPLQIISEVATSAGTSSTASSMPESALESPTTSLTRQPASTVDKASQPSPTEEPVVDSGAMKTAAGVVGVIVAAAVVI